MNELLKQNENQINISAADVSILKMLQNEREIKNAFLENPAAVEELLKSIVIDELKEALSARKTALEYNYQVLKESFISSFNSEHTKRSYRAALLKLENFIFPDFERPCFSDPGKELSKRMFSISFKDADSFIVHLNKNSAAASVLSCAGAASSFYSWLERITEGKLQNSFRGTRARPRLQYENKNKFYSFKTVSEKTLQQVEKDFLKIIENVNPKNQAFRAIIYIMLYRGLRAGSFENMSIEKDCFKTLSKGKIYRGNFSPELQELLSGLEITKESFSSWSAARIENLFKYYSKKLYAAGVIKYSYSCHDARHCYAIKSYFDSKDIYYVSKLLNHNSVVITERYLKGLNVL